MSKNQMIGDVSAWAGMMKDFWRQIGDGSITTSMFASFLQHQNSFVITDIRQDWQEFYRKYFHITVDFTDVPIPDYISDFDRVIFIPKGLKPDQVDKALSKFFKLALHGFLDEHVCTTDKSYAIRLRERVEAEEEFKDMSANDLEEQKIDCIDMLERMIYELKYFVETGQHLDMQKQTLCAISCASRGFVPAISWSSKYSSLCVCGYTLGTDGGEYTCARRVIR